MGNSIKSAAFLIESRLADAERGDPNAYFDLGIAHSSGADGREVDFVQAHKWFNLAALAGSEEGQACRAEIRSEEHTSELQSLMRISYAVFCLKKKKNTRKDTMIKKNKLKHKYQRSTRAQLTKRQ